MVAAIMTIIMTIKIITVRETLMELYTAIILTKKISMFGLCCFM